MHAQLTSEHLTMSTANHKQRKTQTDFTILAKVRLVELGLSVTELARRVSRARNTVSMAINHPSTFPKVRELIERELRL